MAVHLAAQADNFTKEYLLSYPQTAFEAVQQPVKWEKADWLKVGGIIFIGSSLYLFDEEISELAQRNRTALSNDAATVFNQFGEGKYVLPALGLTWLGGYAFDSPQTQDTALLSLKSFVLANSVTYSLKILTQRERPFAGKGKYFFSGSGFTEKDKSFPSGHTTLVWSIAPILAEQYKEVRWVAPTAYSIAAMTSLARIHHHRHWSSDVLAGAAVGYFTSQLVLKTTPRLHISPSLENSGLNFGYRF
ncbi:MAG: phosphatase PAP2 family protein [Candidatus Cloacimonadaceae bacterium]